MKFAVTRSGRTVLAVDARSALDYLCPDCGAGVYLTRGNTQRSHFRHAPNESSIACKNYVLGLGGSGGRTRARSAVEDRLDEPGLGLDVDAGGRWSLFLRVPEIPNRELGSISLRSLEAASVRVRVGDDDGDQISALEIRPGVGRARIQVPPSVANYELTTIGSWPGGIDTRRWNCRSRGLQENGCVFRLRHGEHLRLKEGSTLDWGEHVFVVSELSVPSPLGCVSRRLGWCGFAGKKWSLHRVVLPMAEKEQTARWFTALGLEVVDPSWTVSASSVPIEFDPSGVPLYALGDPVVAEVHSPEADSDALAHLARDRERVFTAISTDDRGGAFLQCTARALGQHTIAAGDLLDSKVTFGVRTALSLEELKAAVNDGPRLIVRIRGEEATGWKTSVALPSGCEPEAFSLTTSHGDLDVTIRLSWREGLRARTFNGALPSATAQLRTLIDNGAERVEVDAGTLGSLHLERSARQVRTAPVKASRLRYFIASLPGEAAAVALRTQSSDERLVRYYAARSAMAPLMRAAPRGRR